MAQNNTILSRFLVDVSSLIVGLAIGLLCLHMFRGGIKFPLESTEALILISSVFSTLLLSAVFHNRIKA